MYRLDDFFPNYCRIIEKYFALIYRILNWKIKKIIILILLWPAGVSVEEREGTWLEAIETCRQLGSVIESNMTVLQQHYLNTNEKFWLPKAAYRTSWIDNLGMLSFSISHSHCYVDKVLPVCK